jgi:hypothetical protein
VPTYVSLKSPKKNQIRTHSSSKTVSDPFSPALQYTCDGEQSATPAHRAAIPWEIGLISDEITSSTPNAPEISRTLITVIRGR